MRWYWKLAGLHVPTGRYAAGVYKAIENTVLQGENESDADEKYKDRCSYSAFGHIDVGLQIVR
jgi:hypothetical protein